MEQFLYKKWDEVLALSASFTDFTYRKHCHEEYAFGVTLSGVQKYHLDGSLERSHPHGVMLFNPEQIHDGMAQDKNGLQYVMLYLKPGFLMKLLETKEMPRFSSPVIYNYKIEESILNLAKAIFAAYDEAVCSELLSALVDNFSRLDLIKADKKESRLTQKAKEIIYCNANTVLRLDEICQEFDISKYKFIRIFKASTGLSPYQYFLNCKLSQAKELIEKSRDVYVAVADCGFVDLTHLNRHFKRIYGTTAFEYLNLIEQ